MDVQIIEEALSSQKRTSSTLKHKISFFFFFFCGTFLPSTELIESGSNPDPKHCLGQYRYLFDGVL
jgi:hypothetical protein